MFRLTGRKWGIGRSEVFKRSGAERQSGRDSAPYGLIVEKKRGREGLKEREMKERRDEKRSTHSARGPL